MRAFTSQLMGSSGIMTSTSVVTSSAIPLPNVNIYSVHVAVNSVGAPPVSGTFKLQCSNDPTSGNLNNPTQNVVNWVDITGASQAASISGSAGVIFNVADAGYSWVRLHYTNTSGSGSFVARATGKMSG